MTHRQRDTLILQLVLSANEIQREPSQTQYIFSDRAAVIVRGPNETWLAAGSDSRGCSFTFDLTNCSDEGFGIRFEQLRQFIETLKNV